MHAASVKSWCPAARNNVSLRTLPAGPAPTDNVLDNRQGNPMKKSFAALLLAACAVPAFAGGMESLEQFIRSAKSGRAEFTQTVTGPAREGQAARSKTSSGTFEFQRPDKFRFTYRKPFEQVIVADGKTLWLYDKDLNQVTQQWQGKVLGSTPAALLAASPDLDTLRRDFELQELPARDGLQWVQATPK
jgi:outer membrane lipoprotein carrier protein